MDFNKLLEYLTELVNFVKPVGGLVSDFYQSLILNIPEFGTLSNVAKWSFIIVILVVLFYRAASE